MPLWRHVLYVEQRPSCYANTSLASQEVPCIIHSLKDHYHFHKGPLLAFILRRIWCTSSQFICSISILILSFHLYLTVPRGLCLSYFPIKILYAFLFSRMLVIRSTELTVIDLITLTTFGEVDRGDLAQLAIIHYHYIICVCVCVWTISPSRGYDNFKFP